MGDLIDAVQMIVREFDVPVALDAGTIRAGKLDPEVTVSGRIGAGDLRKSLVTMLGRAGLTVEVRHEVVLVSPRP